MKENLIKKSIDNKAFTLIEMLIVVLIIGILAAIVLPQYQLASYRSKYATMSSLVRALANAQEEYYMAKGEYAPSDEYLTVGMPKEGAPINAEGRPVIGYGAFSVGAAYASGILMDGDARVASYTIYYKKSTSGNKGQIRCVTYASRQKIGNKICESAGGQLKSSASCGTTGNTICNQYFLSAY